MKDVSRRGLLKGIASLPLVSVFGSVSGPLSWLELESSSPGVAIKQLNVLFHGLFAFFVQEQAIEVATPTVPQHAYKVGTSGCEIELTEPSYTLLGVTGRNSSKGLDLKPTKNVVLSGITKDKNFVKHTLVLPIPDRVEPLRPVHKRDGAEFLIGRKKPQIEPQSLPVVQCFVYTTKIDAASLRLNFLSWKPDVRDHIVNLHVFAEPEGPVDDEHGRMAFGQLIGLLGLSAGDLDLNPVYKGLDVIGEPDRPPAVVGVSCDDELNLRERKEMTCEDFKRVDMLGSNPVYCGTFLVV